MHTTCVFYIPAGYRMDVYPAPLFSATPSTGLSAALAAGTVPRRDISILWFFGSPLKPM